MKIEFTVWVNLTNENLFYEDLIATINGVEAAQIKKSFVALLCKKNGYKFNWKDYSLIKIGE